MDKNFGENLARIRGEKGLSQSGLADKLHISRQAVSNWERGKSYPDLETLEHIACALSVSASELLQEKRGDGLRISLWPLGINLAAAAVHTVLAALGFVNFFAVTIMPWMCVFMTAIVALSFRAMFRSGSYDMLAGFNAKKDSVSAARKQMYWLHLLGGDTLLPLPVFVCAALFRARRGADGCRRRADGLLYRCVHRHRHSGEYQDQNQVILRCTVGRGLGPAALLAALFRRERAPAPG